VEGIMNEIGKQRQQQRSRLCSTEAAKSSQLVAWSSYSSVGIGLGKVNITVVVNNNMNG
jgi:hypothetical protein